MQNSVYTFIRDMLQSAFCKAYPEYSAGTIDIPLTSIVPDSRIDLSTPFPYKISKRYTIPLAQLKENLFEKIDWNNEFLQDTRDMLYSNGFMNFKLSSKFIIRSVYCAGTASYRHDSVYRDYTYPITSTDLFLNDLYQIVSKYDASIHLSACELYNWTRLTTDEEMNIMRTIALSHHHSFNAKRYFRDRLTTESRQFYMKHPIFTSDKELTALRLFLINALFKRISQLT